MDTCNGAPVGNEALATRPVKVRPMVDGCALARRTSERARLPCVEMRIKVDNRDWTVGAMDRAQQWQHDRMVSAKRNYARVVLPILRDRHERLARQRVIR